jgi:hypothetical protein
MIHSKVLYPNLDLPQFEGHVQFGTLRLRHIRYLFTPLVVFV